MRNLQFENYNFLKSVSGLNVPLCHI